jgi:branched-subunit amino acid transport protein
MPQSKKDKVYSWIKENWPFMVSFLTAIYLAYSGSNFIFSLTIGIALWFGITYYIKEVRKK